MRFTCFYSDVPYHALLSEGKSIRDVPRNVAMSDREQMVRYLNGGTAIDQCPGVGVDVFDSSQQTSLDTLTDGEWVWPADASHYCREYGISPHPDLVGKALQSEGVTPVPTPDQIEVIANAFFADVTFDDESTFGVTR